MKYYGNKITEYKMGETYSTYMKVEKDVPNFIW
jgi:hypothetical protein